MIYPAVQQATLSAKALSQSLKITQDKASHLLANALGHASWSAYVEVMKTHSADPLIMR